jgi:hypothetical protein
MLLLVPEKVPSTCFLIEALYWAAFNRLPQIHEDFGASWDNPELNDIGLIYEEEKLWVGLDCSENTPKLEAEGRPEKLTNEHKKYLEQYEAKIFLALLGGGTKSIWQKATKGWFG